MTPPAVITATLDAKEWEVVTRPIVGGGGMQVLLRRILQRANHRMRTVDLFPQDVERIERYAGKYGNGGYQDRMRALNAAILRARGKV